MKPLFSHTSFTFTFMGFLLVTFLLVPFFLFAQISGGSDVSVAMNPSSPSAHEEVSLLLSSSDVDLARAKISWYVNDELLMQNTGVTQFKFRTDDFGSVSKIDIIIQPVTGGKISQSATIRPANVDIVYSSHSYVPSFYRGKARASSQGLIKLTALPSIVGTNGKAVDPRNLIYTWEQEGVVLGSLSGIGKRNIFLKVKTVAGGKTNVSVTVSSFNESVRAQKSIAIQTSAPDILFYEKHPLRGIIYEKASVDAFSLRGEEVTFRAEPYFFSIDNIASGEMRYQWKLNNNKIIQTGENEREITLRQEENIGGTAKIGLDIENLSRLLQYTEKSFFINFGENRNF